MLGPCGVDGSLAKDLYEVRGMLDQFFIILCSLCSDIWGD